MLHRRALQSSLPALPGLDEGGDGHSQQYQHLQSDLCDGKKTEEKPKPKPKGKTKPKAKPKGAAEKPKKPKKDDAESEGEPSDDNESEKSEIWDPLED